MGTNIAVLFLLFLGGDNTALALNRQQIQLPIVSGFTAPPPQASAAGGQLPRGVVSSMFLLMVLKDKSKPGTETAIKKARCLQHRKSKPHVLKSWFIQARNRKVKLLEKFHSICVLAGRGLGYNRVPLLQPQIPRLSFALIDWSVLGSLMAGHLKHIS